MIVARLLLVLLGQSLLTFLTLALLIELLFLLVRPSSPRLRYLVRIVPLVKLPIDLALGCSPLWVGWSGIDPALQDVGSRFLTLSANWPFCTLVARLHLDSGETFGWVDWWVARTPNWAVLLLLALWLALFAATALRLILRWRATRDAVSRGGTLPFAYRKRIFLPPRIVQLCSPQEVEAILAHERAHLRWRDGEVGLLLSAIATLFCFVPFVRHWRRKIDLECERGCDAAANDRDALLSALCTVSRFSIGEERALFSSFGRHPLHKRVDWLTRKRGRFAPVLQWICPYFVLGWLFSSLWRV